jgi:hypothetical protein
MIESPYLTCEEAAAYLRFDVSGPDPGSAVRKLVQRGELRPAGRGGRGKLLFRREQLDRWLLRFEPLEMDGGEPPRAPRVDSPPLASPRRRQAAAPSDGRDRWGLRALLRDEPKP